MDAELAAELNRALDEASSGEEEEEEEEEAEESESEDGDAGEDGDEDEDEDEEAEAAQDARDSQHRPHRGDVRRDVPFLPRIIPCLTEENVFAWSCNDGVPAEVLAAPLLCEDAEEGGGEGKDEAREPQDVHRHDVPRRLEGGGGGERRGSLV